MQECAIKDVMWPEIMFRFHVPFSMFETIDFELFVDTALYLLDHNNGGYIAFIQSCHV